MLPPNAPSLFEVIQNLWRPWWVYIISVITVVILTPLLRRLAIRWQLYDRPEGLLKPHAKPIPYLGGVAVFVAWALPVLIWAFSGAGEHVSKIMAIVSGAVILLLLGLVDDLREVKPSYRLLVQVAVAVGLFAAGIQFRAVPQINVGGITFFAPESLEFKVVGLLIQILLIAGASNAINLLDGLDGLCGGVIVIIAAGFLLVATHIGAWAVPEWCAVLVGSSYPLNQLVMVLAMALTAAALGFLLYNFNPATIFLGDAGSNFLGYLAAVFIILFADKPGMLKWFLAGLMIMGLPIFDTALALVRRIRNKRRVFGGDRSHFYDQLVDRGLSVSMAVVVCYILAAITVLVALASLALRTREIVPLYLLILAAVAAFASFGGFIKVDETSALKSNDKSGSEPREKPAKKLIILGAGGLARELANAVGELNKVIPSFEILGYLDDEQELQGQKQLDLPVLGAVEELAQYKRENLYVVPATGNGHIREKFAQIAHQHGIALATIIHPGSIIGKDSLAEEGVFVAAGCVITVNVHMGKCALVNMGCTIAHDVRLGDYSSVHPGAQVSGEVIVKDYALIGTGSVILNKCTIGKSAVVAMGAVVAHDVPDYTLVAGNPARVIKKLPKP